MTDEREDEIAARQDGRVYPVGRFLRTTYDADNHDSLDAELAGLMIDLSRVPYAAAEQVKRPPPPAGVPAAAIAARKDEDRPGWRARLGRMMGRRH